MKAPHVLAGLFVIGATLASQESSAQDSHPRDIPGAVQMDNGLIVRGMCGTSSTLSPLGIPQSLELRRIEQQVRTYFVSTRRSRPVTPDNQVLPRHSFDIRQKRTSAKPMEYSIGQHRTAPFSPEGLSFLELYLAEGKTARIDVGITKVNSQFVTVTGLSHRWEYWVSMTQIPDSTLYTGNGRPCLLRKAEGFRKGENRLNMVQMLLEANKFVAARDLIADTRREYPSLERLCEDLDSAWNDLFGQRVIDELNRLESTGKHIAARRYARQWPKGELDPVVEVRARKLIRTQDENTRRVTNIRQSLSRLLAEIENPTTHQQALSMWNRLKDHVELDTLDRFDSYELFAVDDTLAPESRFALAATGWMLGAEFAFDDFIEAEGLYQIRHLLIDYLQSDPSESALRNDLIAQIRRQEGYSIDRVAQLVRFLQSNGNLEIVPRLPHPAVVAIDSTSVHAGALIQVPAEYSENRSYPVLIALPRGGMTSLQTLEWWSLQANRQGYLLVVPELYQPEGSVYDASAEDHKRMTQLLRLLKANVWIDDRRVFIGGHGIGGEAAMDLASSQPELFAGIFSLGGRGRRHVQWTAQNSIRLPWYVVVGTRQPNYFSRMDILLRTMFRRNVNLRKYHDVVFVRYRERGFESFAEEVPRLFEWMNAQKRNGYPDQIDATIVRSTDSDWSWLELQGIPERFACLDMPNSHTTSPRQIPGKSPGRLSARLTRNLVRISSLPASGYLKLNPELPGVDLEKPVTLRVAAKSRSVRYEPSVGDLLDDFYRLRDRSRLCFMKVPLRK